MTDQPPLLTTKEVAEYLGVPVATLYRWRYVGTGPPAIKLGVHLRFESEDLAAWLDSRKEGRRGAADSGG